MLSTSISIEIELWLNLRLLNVAFQFDGFSIYLNVFILLDPYSIYRKLPLLTKAIVVVSFQ